ncbi:cobalamin-binding protein [Denitromonas ohlonensis]|uniref:Cobalamin-binding protein n=2 Tax=Denitromonas TaxID=139331 RepID=A0A557RPH5_9RHOO|nr:cobalamin-binding protein [Denitromonas ohlonensis]TVO67084.1 cobalamin-binding protein [Denitromonas ohlonensis]TVO79144.1 cobalamin-binding protein [Denitromonas ohlonensis]
MTFRFSALILTLALLIPGPPAHAQLTVTDDVGQSVALPTPARRIVSLAPHVTELIYAAGAGHMLVGAVDYSDYPAEARAVKRIGSYVRIDLEAVAALKPDVVIGWRSGNPATQLERLRALGLPVYINEPRSLDAVAHSLRQIGILAGTQGEANRAADAFVAHRNRLRDDYGSRPPVPVFYQIWNQPLMTINGHHLISDVIRLCGGHNVFDSLDVLAPKIGVEAVLASNPEAIVASGMGESRPEWLDEWRKWPTLTAVQQNNLFFVPPDLIQRHTPRILDGADRLCRHLDTARGKRTP